MNTGLLKTLIIISYFIPIMGVVSKLGPLGTSATGDSENEDWQGKPKYSEKTCPSDILSATNPT
jgi:hypothetical protein